MPRATPGNKAPPALAGKARCRVRICLKMHSRWFALGLAAFFAVTAANLFWNPAFRRQRDTPLSTPLSTSGSRAPSGGTPRVRDPDGPERTAALGRGERRLTEWLTHHDQESLSKALREFQAARPIHLAALYAAWCLESKGSIEERDSLLSAAGVDPFEYRFYFDTGVDQRRMLAAMQALRCRSQLWFVQSALRIYSAEHDGALPPSLDALVPQWLDAVPICPTSGDLRYAASYQPDRGAAGPRLSCGAHSRAGVPSVEFSNNVVDGVGLSALEREFQAYIQLNTGLLQKRKSPHPWLDAGPGYPGIRAGRVVADIGCGVGTYTFEMAQRAGNLGTIYAVDIVPQVLDFVRYVAERAPYPTVKTVVSTPRDVSLPAGSVDDAFLISVFKVIDDRVGAVAPNLGASDVEPFLRSLRRAVRPGGYLVVVAPTTSTNPTFITTSDFARAGFEPVRLSFGGRDNVLIYRVRGPEKVSGASR